MGEPSNRVPQLVDPLVAEMAAVVRASLDPAAYFGDDAADDAANTDRFFQVPTGSLVFCEFPDPDNPVDPDGPKDIKAFAYMPEHVVPKNRPENLRVLGVAASPIDDPAVVSRHRDELAHLAVYVSGTHTIFAHPEDCKELYPTNYIRVNFAADWPGRLELGSDLDPRTGAVFPVPAIEKVPSPEEADAMVLQVGQRELRILLLTQRFRRRREGVAEAE
jgi:hypothetical protein